MLQGSQNLIQVLLIRFQERWTHVHLHGSLSSGISLGECRLPSEVVLGALLRLNYSHGNANQTLGCVWETLALMGARHLISPRWLEEM